MTSRMPKPIATHPTPLTESHTVPDRQVIDQATVTRIADNRPGIRPCPAH